MNLDNSDLFEGRHLGLNDNDEKIMLKKLGFNSIEDFINQVVPKDIQLKNPSKANFPLGCSEIEASKSINKLASLIGAKKKVYLPFRPGEPRVTHANIDKIVSDVNWKPKIKFEIGVQLMLNNIKYWKNAPLWNANNIKSATKTWFKYMKKYE